MGTTLPPLRDVLAAAAREARHIAAAGLAAQDGLSALLLAGPDAAEMQALDVLVQQAEGLESFLAALAAVCPQAWRADASAASSGLLLAAQRQRLSLDDAVTALPDLSGTLELF